MVQADPDRHALRAVIAFPDAGWCYVIEDARQLKAIIEKLQTTYGHLTAHGQSRTINFSPRHDYNN